MSISANPLFSRVFVKPRRCNEDLSRRRPREDRSVGGLQARSETRLWQHPTSLLERPENFQKMRARRGEVTKNLGIRCQKSISGILMQVSHFSVPDTFLSAIEAGSQLTTSLPGKCCWPLARSVRGFPSLRSSRITTRTWKRRTFARASRMRSTLWLLRTAAWQQRNEVLDPLCGWRVGPQETTLDDSEGAVVAECCSFLVLSAP